MSLISTASLRTQVLRLNKHPTTNLRLGPSVRFFSESPNLYGDAARQNPPKTNSTQNQQRPNSTNPSYPAFSFESMGLSKRMKVSILVLLSIFGTIETWFWCQTIWRWWKGGQQSRED
ncbi:hypothetical protein FZEAL_2153 [Fusarium zealandicum]|uniref:Uncharacterized protein n=1 Tax=Fusarium zealandicum TaxID=1053134 RepID=A0A8H4URD3_9HYPO|nr:hypothetical protein FZEAL_2153 [Fusarium zealandicum]